MKQLLLSMIVLLAATAPAVAIEGDLNKMAHVAALAHTERAPRSKKWLWLKPGKPVFYHYKWVLEDGTEHIQILTAPLKHVPDGRPFVESHPNLARIIPALINGGGNAFGNFVGNKI